MSSQEIKEEAESLIELHVKKHEFIKDIMISAEIPEQALPDLIRRSAIKAAIVSCEFAISNTTPKSVYDPDTEYLEQIKAYLKGLL